MKIQKLTALALALALLFALTACGAPAAEVPAATDAPVEATEAPAEPTAAPAAAAEEAAEAVTVRLAALTGPTAMGMAKIFSDADAGTAANDYEYALYGAADELTPQLLQGGVDIAAVPLNLASVLYNKTSGGVKLCAVGVLGVLYITEFNGETVQSLADLKGKTVYAGIFPAVSARRERARSRHRRDRGMEERAERGRRAPQGRKRRHCDAAAALCHRRCRAARRGLPRRGEPFRGVGRAR